jgi:hypothetical protein
MTTRVARAEPLTVGGERPPERSVHPAVWVVMGVLLLASVVMALTDHLLPALISLVGGVIALTIGILQKFGATGQPGVTLARGRRLGRGPHREVDLDQAEQLLQRLSNELKEWRQAATERGWSVQWSEFDRDLSEASELTGRNELAAAMRRLAHATRLLAEHQRP